jgi:hypothetical protein
MKSLKLTIPLLLLVYVGQAAASGVKGWVLEPGVTSRGAQPATWLLDLRGQGIEEAKIEASKLSSRLYGPGEPKLHAPLVIRTGFPEAHVLGITVAAVSQAGGDLVVKTNGVIAGRQAWPPAAATHRVNRTFTVPVAAGDHTLSLEVTRRGGVVVVSRYVVAPSAAAIPQDIPIAPFGSTNAVEITSTPTFAGVPETGGKLEPDDGYRGIWYYNQPISNEYKFKYSGGFATYPYQHAPIAIYCKEVEKTFFVYGGTTARSAQDKQELLHMVSYFDHKTGMVPKPRILLNKQTGDAHDNPTLQVDDRGHLWIFSSSHGTGRPSFIHRSVKPWSIDEFERVLVTNFSYTQPWYVPGEGFLFLHTRYGGGRPVGNNAARCLFWMTSVDGRKWEEPQMLAGIEQGDYQVSWRHGSKVATAFDFHPVTGGLNARANVYYLETTDMGRSWKNVRGEKVNLPLGKTNNPALAFDSRADGLLAYMRDVNFDEQGRPVILFVTSKGFEPGPENGPRQWHTLRWTGSEWDRRFMTTSGNNYDHGSLYIEPGGLWRVIAPTEAGPQPYNPGGEMVLWTSRDQGRTWTRVKQLTNGSKLNHTFARRPVNAHAGFYALWADGHGRQPSESSLYFTDKEGTHVWRMPTKMTKDFESPAVVTQFERNM